MDNLFIALRVIVSLAAVLGLLYVLQRRLVPRLGAAGHRHVDVVARQGIGPKASVVLVDVEGRRYLLGVAEHAVSVLDSFDVPAETAVPDAPPGGDDGGDPFAPSLRRAREAQPGSPLAGSVLSGQTWRQAAAALRRSPSP